MTFNPFSSRNRGREYLTLTPDTDHGSNYFHKLIQMIDDCDYHNEDSFKQKISSCDGAMSNLEAKVVRQGKYAQSMIITQANCVKNLIELTSVKYLFIYLFIYYSPPHTFIEGYSE